MILIKILWFKKILSLKNKNNIEFKFGLKCSLFSENKVKSVKSIGVFYYIECRFKFKFYKHFKVDIKL